MSRAVIVEINFRQGVEEPAKNEYNSGSRALREGEFSNLWCFLDHRCLGSCRDCKFVWATLPAIATGPYCVYGVG